MAEQRTAAARLSATAERQVNDLVWHYLAKDRPEAVTRLSIAIRQAVVAITAGPTNGRPYPGPYRELSGHDFRWIKVGRYWFAYADFDGQIIISNVIFETADLPRRFDR